MHQTAAARSVAPHIAGEDVWRELEKVSFAVLSHVTPTGEPRSSGVLYAAEGGRLYVVTAATSWKARQIADGDQVAVTVPIRRGGLLSLVAPIPPATVSFHAEVTRRPAGSMSTKDIPPKLDALLPTDRHDGVVVLELEPLGSFLTYGVGVGLRDMRDPAASRARVAVS
jgi:hypothetical protein